MGWRFRRSFKVIPGLRLNLSRSGLSLSIGGAPFTVNVSARGTTATASIPGTGLSFRKRLTSKPTFARAAPPETPRPISLPPELNAPPSLEKVTGSPGQIRSANVDGLTSETLFELKALIELARNERQEIRAELTKAKRELAHAAAALQEWENAVLMKWVRKSAYLESKEQAETIGAKVSELEEQLLLTIVNTQTEIGEEQSSRYYQMCDAFLKLAQSERIWDITAECEIDPARERTFAKTGIDHKPVRFSSGSCELIHLDNQVPHLENANGGDLFLYPGFILCRESDTAFAVISYHDVKVAAVGIRCVGGSDVPKEARIIGHTWEKVNKDGTPDLRFAGNREIPIVFYGQLDLRTDQGLNESFLFSNVEALEAFVIALRDFVMSFENKTSCIHGEENDSTGLT